MRSCACTCVDPRAWSVAEVQNWVESVGYHEYREAFAEGRVNGRKLMGMTAGQLQSELILPSPEVAELLEMEIGELRARRGLFASRAERDAHFAAHPLADTWDVAGVAAFLREVGFPAAAARFSAAGVNGPALLRLGEAELRTLAAPPASAASDPYEQGMADAEQILALVAHLRWRSVGAAQGGVKEEL